MQATNQTFSEFSRRTEVLAEKLDVRLIDLPKALGISKAMLFAYRKGSYAISGKAWRKLEQAERDAGLAAPFQEQWKTAEGEDAARLLESATRNEVWEMLSPEVRSKLAEGDLDQMNLRVIEFLMNAESLAVATKELMENPRSKEARKEALFFSEKVQGTVRPMKRLWSEIFQNLRPTKKTDGKTEAE